jgi:hypothetical protein
MPATLEKVFLTIATPQTMKKIFSILEDPQVPGEVRDIAMYAFVGLAKNGEFPPYCVLSSSDIDQLRKGAVMPVTLQRVLSMLQDTEHKVREYAVDVIACLAQHGEKQQFLIWTLG